ncbi:SleB Cell wall hydrolyses involved in spore germination [uncultured Caudovirales phage]|uniref:SleB Cell wall hydrolyses involved in spore germination n=1 Tax=uncultured Caudovirales phage TaxID=2100421 RepID=A0A6J7X2A6_9CAUD|nr:SleB Cell wall hydrolyses involved in spore germination [uncultured Caudovirales phage]
MMRLWLRLLLVALMWFLLGAFIGRALAATPDRQRTCLAQAVYWEARGQPFNSQIAVAQVVMNRVEDGRFRPDICGVVYQRNANGCQFAWVCAGLNRPRDRQAWQRALVIAEIAQTDYIDLVDGALFFHDTSIRRWRHLEKTARIGDLVFYRER